MNRHFSKAAGLLLPVALIAGCTTSETGGPAMPEALGHIHGLGIDPSDDSLYVATHTGVYRVSDGGRRTRIADRRQDTMGFTVIGPRHFLASGHPDVGVQGPPHLGLIESTDAGETWDAVAMQGQADFHILEPAGKTLYAYDALSGTLTASTDRRTFTPVIRTPLLSVAALPSGDLLGADNRARLIRVDSRSGKPEPTDGPRVVVLDTTSSGDVVALGPDGTVRVSRDAARTWTTRGSIHETPAALTTATDTWYAATAATVFRSADRGKTWTVVLDESAQ